jgi:hypothetical protein
MTRILSWEEIKKKYPNQWVSLSDLEYDKQNEIVSAVVFSANPQLSEVTVRSKGVKFNTHAFRFTGKISPNVGLMKWGINAN